MKCPSCGSLDDKVIESRTLSNGANIRRRRECISCGYRFTSYEQIEDKPFMVVKRDMRRQPFERAKLAKGIERALEKRPVSSVSIENLLSEIENEAYRHGKQTNEISTADLGDLVLEYLHKLDRVAYIRFASVYRHFEDIDEFTAVIKELRRGSKK